MGNDHQAQQSAFSSIKNAEQFEDKFWSGTDLSQLYQKVKARKDEIEGTEEIFYAGFTEFARLRKSNANSPAYIMEGTGRAMRVAVSREVDELETSLPFLATVGSISLISAYLVPFGASCTPLLRWVK